MPVLLAVRGSMSVNCISMNNQSCIVRPTLIDLNPDEIYYYQFIISINRCHGRCNTTKDPYCWESIGTICFPDKMEEQNLKVFKGILQPIFYIDINTYIDRKWKIMQNLLKNYFFKMFKFLLTFCIDIIISVVSSTQIACDVICVQHVIH